MRCLGKVFLGEHIYNDLITLSALLPAQVRPKGYGTSRERTRCLFLLDRPKNKKLREISVVIGLAETTKERRVCIIGRNDVENTICVSMLKSVSSSRRGL